MAWLAAVKPLNAKAKIIRARKIFIVSNFSIRPIPLQVNLL
jgi:hypothetical protein